MNTCVESEQFHFAKSIIAEAAEVDEALSDLVMRIAAAPRVFPIVALPNTRVGVTHTTFGRVAVVFQMQTGRKSVLLLHTILDPS